MSGGMIIELRALFSAFVIACLSVLLLFFQWQLVFPLVALAYLAYKYVYFWRRIDPDRDLSSETRPGSLLEKMALLFVVVFLATRLAVVPLFSPLWGMGTLGVPDFDLTDPAVFLDQLLPFLGAWATVLVPLLLVSFVVSQFRGRLLGGVDSVSAAIRAALWETSARIPLVFLWLSIFTLGPVYEFWRGLFSAVVSPLGLSIPPAVGIAPLVNAGGNVFAVVALAGHLVPVGVVAAYAIASRGKYGDLTVPEWLGFRGFYPPDRTAALVNYVLPGLVYLAYAVVVVLLVPLGPVLRGALLLPPLVAIPIAADVRGSTSRLMRALPGGSGGTDPVAVGLVAGFGLLGLLVLTRVAGAGLGVDPAAVLYFPVFGAPVAFGVSAALGFVKAGSAASMADRVEDDPGALSESAVDRLLVYADARNDRLRAAAIEGLAAAVLASPYREKESVAVFETALERDDEGFTRAGLRGVVSLFRADRGLDSVGPMLDPGVAVTVVDGLDGEQAETRALAAEAFCRLVTTGYRAGRADELLAALGAVPLEPVEAAVGGEAANQHLTDAAVEAYAVLWYARTGTVGRSLTAADERAVLTDLVWWSAYASEVPRGEAAFAVASGPAPTDEAGLDGVREHLYSEVALTRYTAAHVVRSSMGEHADQFTAEELVGLLEDGYDLVRWVGADALREYVRTTGDTEGVLGSLLAHLEEVDPATAGAAEATVLSTLGLVDGGTLADRTDAVETVAAYVDSGDRAVAAAAAGVLATVVAERPESGRDESVRTAIERGLTHDSDAVRRYCARAAAAVVSVSPGDGRPFVRGLVLNLGTTGEISEMAASTLIQVLDDYPEYGTEFLPETVGGLRNPTTISRQYAGAMVVGRTVSSVTARVLAEITEYDTSGGDVLVAPLVDLAGNTQSATREHVFAALANISEDYPEAAREALSAAESALDSGDVRVRRNAAQVLSNVAIEYPDAVAPFASTLIVAVDDTDPQMRSIALVTLGTVGTEAPDAVEPDVRRVIGRLDDDSSLVREHAAKALVTIASKHPEIVEPGAEASDRLRRAQRDPAVDIDEELVREAANAIRTGTPPGEAVEGTGDEGSTDIFTPEAAGEAGQSGDTRVFEPPNGDDGSDLPGPEAGGVPTADPESADLPDPGEVPTADPGEDVPEAEPDGDASTGDSSGRDGEESG